MYLLIPDRELQHRQDQEEKENQTSDVSEADAPGRYIDDRSESASLYRDDRKYGKKNSNQAFTSDHTGRIQDAAGNDTVFQFFICVFPSFKPQPDQTARHKRSGQVDRQIQPDGNRQNRNSQNFDNDCKCGTDKD